MQIKKVKDCITGLLLGGLQNQDIDKFSQTAMYDISTKDIVSASSS